MAAAGTADQDARSGAFATLKELTRIEEAAGERAVKLRAAARHREQAALAADMKDRRDPGVTTLTVLEEWEAAAERDPGHFETWIYLTRLRQEAGQTADALASARQARQVATSDRDRAWAASDLGDIQQAAGDLGAARVSYADSQQILQRLAAANPTSAQAQRDVWVSLWRLAKIPGSGVTWTQVRDAMQAMKDRNVLLPSDQRFLNQAKSCAAKG